MRFAKWTFGIAGVYGLLVLLPLYFLEARISRDNPPPITHPELYYGFVGVAAAWQIVFLIISRDPARYRPLMLASIMEKLAFGVAVIVLFAQGRIATPTLGVGLPDLLLAALFAASYLKTAR